jgi:hypothetical protein
MEHYREKLHSAAELLQSYVEDSPGFAKTVGIRDGRMVSLREQYERRKASFAAKPNPVFTLKDYVTIGISVLALGTTLFFNVFLKTDDVRGAFRGSPPEFRVSGEDLFVLVDASLVVTNTGNRAATIVGAYLLLVSYKDKNVPDNGDKNVPDSACFRRVLSLTLFDLKPVVLKAGEAAVIRLNFEKEARGVFPNIEKDGPQILACMGVAVLTPSAIFDSYPVPRMIAEVKEGEPRLLKFKRLVNELAPFIIYRKWSLFW